MTTPATPAIPLTTPVRHAGQRPTPRWVGWFLILLPTLAAGGPLLGVGPVFAFRAAIVVLFVTAAWDWWRFQDRSRTFYVTLALGAAFAVAGVVALGWSKPPLGPALTELAGVGLLFGVALAFVQLYRTAETVLTIARGWLYMLVLVIVEAAWEIVSGNRLPNFYLPPEMRGVDFQWDQIAGPFHNPNQLAAACCMALLVMPIGFALEHDRRLRWAYPVVCLPVPWIILHTGSTLGLLLCLVILGTWALLHRWTRITAVPFGVVALVVLPQGRSFLTTLWGQLGAVVQSNPDVWYSSSDRFNLMRDGVVMLRRSLWLGVGPGGFPHVMSTDQLPYPTHGIVDPHSAIVEITAQYGLSVFVAVTLVVIGAMRWCVQRLLKTRGLPFMSPERAPAVWLLMTLALWPVSSMMNSTWLLQSMSALQLATIVMLARHHERPKGRLVVPSETALRQIPAGPTVGRATGTTVGGATVPTLGGATGTTVGEATGTAERP